MIYCDNCSRLQRMKIIYKEEHPPVGSCMDYDIHTIPDNTREEDIEVDHNFNFIKIKKELQKRG